MMRRTFLALAMMTLLACFIAPVATAADVGHRDVALSGVIERVGDHGFVLHTRGHGSVAIGVVERTRITLNGERAELSDLQHGDHARVRAIIRHDRHRDFYLIATHVMAYRRE